MTTEEWSKRIVRPPSDGRWRAVFFDYEVLDENADALKCGQFGCFTFSREQLVKSFEF